MSETREQPPASRSDGAPAAEVPRTVAADLPEFGPASYAPAPEGTDLVHLADDYGLFIGGEMVPARSEQLVPTVNPATGERLATFAVGGGHRR